MGSILQLKTIDMRAKCLCQLFICTNIYYVFLVKMPLFTTCKFLFKKHYFLCFNKQTLQLIFKNSSFNK